MSEEGDGGADGHAGKVFGWSKAVAVDVDDLGSSDGVDVGTCPEGV